MNKLFLTLVFSLYTLAAAYAQQYSVKVVSSNEAETVLKVLVSSFDWQKPGDRLTVRLDDAQVFPVDEGMEVPVINVCVLQDDKTLPVVITEIVSSVDFNAFDIAASESNRAFNGMVSSAQQQNFARIKNSFTDGNHTGMVLDIFPVQYMADENKLRLCTEMLVKVCRPL